MANIDRPANPSRPTNQNSTCFVYLTPTPKATSDGSIQDPW